MTTSIVATPVTPPDRPKGHWFFGGAIAISLLMHAVAGVALMDRVERQRPEPEETPVMVDLVPPPEQEAPEIPEAPEVAEVPEVPEALEPPPRPEEQPKLEEQLAEAPPNVPVLQPVIEFGETDSGPRIDPDGVSAQEPDEPEQSEPDAKETEVKQAAETGPSEGLGDEADGTPKEQELSLAEVAEPEPGPEPEPESGPEPEPEPESGLESGPEPEPVEVAESAVAADDSPDDAGAVGPIASLVTPKPRPARKPAAAARKKTGNPGGMTRATRLFSRETLSDPRVRTAMVGIPRSERVNILCMTEMRGQLGAARPPRPPEFLPTFRVPTGNVLQPRQAAFRSRGQWYNFTFRCEVDKAATKVMKFSYRIGKAIPRVDWARRGLPGL